MDPLTRTVRPLKWRRKRKPLSQEVRNTYRVLAVTLLIMGLASTGTYLYTNSLQPAKGYQLKQLQMDQESLESELRKLNRQVIEAKSFINIQASEILQKMETSTSDQFSYLEDETYAQETSDTVQN